MSTLASNAMHKANRKERVTIKVDPYDYYDTTNKRWKSGMMAVAVTGITWTNNSTSEIFKACIKPPNYNDSVDVKYEGSAARSAGTLGTLTYNQNIALNYGRFGPSAEHGPDGQAELLHVDLELPEDTTATTLVATVTYTLTFVEVATTEGIDTGLSVSGEALTVNLNRDDTFAMGHFHAISVTNFAVVQLISNVITSHDNDEKDDAPPVQLTIRTPGGVVLVNHPVGKAAKTTQTYHDRYTWVFAVNNGLMDRNGRNLPTNVAQADVYLFYQLIEVMLAKQGPTDDAVSLELTTKVGTDR